MHKSLINWQNVRDYISNNLMCKLPAISCSYSNIVSEVKKRKISMGAYIYHNILHFDSFNADKKYLLTLNDFPYYIDGDVTQLILWTNTKGISKRNKVGKRGKKRNPFWYDEYIIEQIQRILELDDDEIIVFEDAPESLRTRAIPYVNILIARKYDQTLDDQIKMVSRSMESDSQKQ